MSSKFLRIALLTLIVVIVMVYGADAQCAMCKMSAETNLKDGGKTAAGLNQGIIYLLSAPYLLASTVGFFWWKNKKEVREEELRLEVLSLLEPLSNPREIGNN